MFVLYYGVEGDMAKKTREWRQWSSFMEQYPFKKDKSDVEEVEESYDVICDTFACYIWTIMLLYGILWYY